MKRLQLPRAIRVPENELQRGTRPVDLGEHAGRAEPGIPTGEGRSDPLHDLPGDAGVGLDTEADVRREFGAPRLVVPFPRTGLVGWMFPYLENDIWNSEMAIYFDAQGIVRRLENGPDPRFLGGGNDRH